MSLRRLLEAWRGPQSLERERPVEAPENAPDYVDSRDCGLVDAVQSGWYQSETDELFKGFPVSADDVVLDVGCGAGGATLFCANRGARVIFSDVVEEKIEALRQRVASTPARDAQGIVSDSCPLPLEDALATRVIALEMLEHVDDPAQVLAELVRVGQPGALYLLAVPDAAGEHLQKRFAPSYYFSAPNHVRIFEREQFAGLVRESGLEVLQQSTFGFYWTLWMCIYWTCARATGAELEGATHDVVQPPYPPLLNDWAKLWHQLLKMPESAPMKAALDDLLPKSQVIVARKPESRRS
ncbi:MULTISPECIES: class I SAM-dependent methyltransferase [Pseudomonas aeruginosa group]|uniref:class I SAM-dependent methyltransferase n=1 Tax=Pseudomonas aeruginosa group TaxID=136841 RepID=UPI00071BC1F9|nr:MULTISPECIES: class I SAM-dependent methyltransferase [Pseudomonas aeruginosa group]OKR59021.1 SAM-dependent methyltransferase [Pseudomonas aeruginosa]